MKKYFLLFIVCFAIFITHLILVRHGIYGDGNGYYTYTQALYFEKSLNFGPIYNHLEKFQGIKGEFSRIFWDTSSNPFPIGTGIIWVPSIAIISLFTADRFSIVYEVGPGLTGILLVMGGLYFLEKYLQNFFSKNIAFFSVLFFFLTSNLFYYSSFEPALSHQPAFFLISFLLWKTYNMPSKNFNYFLVGALSGLLFITRVPDIILLIPIYWQILKSSPSVKNWTTILISAIIFSLPLFWSYYAMFGDPFRMPYLSSGIGRFTFSITKIMEFLFTAKRGLFTWTPIYIFGFIGLMTSSPPFWRGIPPKEDGISAFNSSVSSSLAVFLNTVIKSRKLIFLLSLTILILVCSFWASSSVEFGQRFVVGGIPYFAFGLAKFIEKLNIKYTAILFILLLTWNLLTIFQFYFDKADLIKNDNLTFLMFFKGQFESPIKAFGIIKDRGLNYLIYKKILY